MFVVPECKIIGSTSDRKGGSGLFQRLLHATGLPVMRSSW